MSGAEFFGRFDICVIGVSLGAASFVMNRRIFLGLFFVIAFVPACFLRAADPLVYLTDHAPNAPLLLPAPPAQDSLEQKAEIETVRRIHDAATTQQLEVARYEIELSFFSFSHVIGPWFKPGRFPITEALFKQVEVDTRVVTTEGKVYFHRKRPYVMDPTIVALENENTFSYPSGHSTRGTVFTLVLAELFPEKRAALLEAGRDSGFHRIQAGVHFPSDIYAGRVLGAAIVQGFLKSPRFREDLAAARAELASGGK